MAGFGWWSGVVCLVVLVVWVILYDVALWYSGEQLITDYLRHHPWAFWSGAVATVAGIAYLAVHLFVQAVVRNGSGDSPVP
jgi:hypothetical protein